MPLAPGELVGRYRVERRIATGGMGEVWIGEQEDLGYKVAIKRVLPGGTASHEAVARFKREGQLLGRLRSDYVARVLDFVHDEASGLLIIMELIPGDVLADVLGRRKLTVEETIELGCDLAGALCDLHRSHIVHRDLKPGNVILRPLSDGRHRAVLIDLGISRVISGSTGTDEEESLTGITKTNMVLGTIEYMSPEQILSSRKVGYGADLYALGAILFRAAAGRHVFGAMTEGPLARAKLTTDAPPLALGRTDHVALGLAQVVARALERHPNKRYDDAALMLAELAALRDLAKASTIIDFDSTTTDDNFDTAALAAAIERARSGGAPAPLPKARAIINDDTTETVTYPITSQPAPAPQTSAPPPPEPRVSAPPPAPRPPLHTPSTGSRSLSLSEQQKKTRRGQLLGLVGGLAAGITFGLALGAYVRRGSSPAGSAYDAPAPSASPTAAASAPATTASVPTTVPSAAPLEPTSRPVADATASASASVGPEASAAASAAARAPDGPKPGAAPRHRADEPPDFAPDPPRAAGPKSAPPAPIAPDFAPDPPRPAAAPKAAPKPAPRSETEPTP